MHRIKLALPRVSSWTYKAIYLVLVQAPPRSATAHHWMHPLPAEHPRHRLALRSAIWLSLSIFAFYCPIRSPPYRAS